MSRVGDVFEFPNPVNEKAARSVAGGVVLICALTLLLTWTVGHQALWLTVVLGYGFLARVAAGPRFSPLGRLATQLVAPRLGTPRPVPGPPKRFAQGMGLVMALTAVVCTAAGAVVAAEVFIAMILVAATLESVFAICLGCTAFGWLMRVGVIPDTVCAECADVSARLARSAPAS
jgi:hypothetical protein